MVGKKDFRVLVIGGGNCGLLLATGLKKNGINYTVFEKESEDDFVHRPRNWGMLLHWGQEYLPNLLPQHLVERVREMRPDPTIDDIGPIPHFDGQTGDILKATHTAGIVRVTRRKVRKLLHEGQNLNIEFGKRLREVTLEGDDLVKATFEDGTSATGNIIIGADGSNSPVRVFLVGPEAAKEERLPYTMINFPSGGFTADQAHFLRSFHPVCQLGFGEKLGASLLAVIDIPDPNDTKDWQFQNYYSWWGPPYAEDLQDPKERLKFFKERRALWCEPFKTAGLAAPDDIVIPVFSGVQWAPTMDWDNRGGRVTLAGDAAHSMMPNRGQGLNNAVKDASEIVDAIVATVAGKTTLKAAITAYEAEMKPRGAKEVEMSYEQALASRTVEDFKNSSVAQFAYDRAQDVQAKRDAAL